MEAVGLGSCNPSAMPDGVDPRRLQDAMSAPVHQGERYVPFGDLTAADVRGQAERIGSAGSWGPLARAAKVARAWRELGATMETARVGRVRELEPEAVVQWAERTWVISPAGGMI
jgi:hypothetical protein